MDENLKRLKELGKKTKLNAGENIEICNFVSQVANEKRLGKEHPPRVNKIYSNLCLKS